MRQQQATETRLYDTLERHWSDVLRKSYFHDAAEQMMLDCSLDTDETVVYT